MTEGSLVDLERKFGAVLEGLSLFRGFVLRFFPFGLRCAFIRRGYSAMEDLLRAYMEIRDKLPAGASLELEELLLGIHDAYVRQRNQELCLQEPLFFEESSTDRASGCRQCGECCKGPASGPLSTSPIDLALWEKLGREDLLHYTLKGVWTPSEKIDQQWAACPFLRFSRNGEGICLVHPVKPMVCREFSCRKSSA